MDLLVLLAAKLSFIWEIGIPFLIALTILVFVHELGHYAVARWSGVKVEVFSIGFGTEIKGWNDRHGTRWKISAVPLGGYVKMFGENENVGEGEDERSMTAEEEAVSFYHKSLMQRAAVVFAGPFINFIFAIFAFAALFAIIGVPQPETDRPLAVVGMVSPNSAAETAKLKPGDQIVQIGNEKISFFKDLQRVISGSPGKQLEIEIVRQGRRIKVNVTPAAKQRTDKSGKSVTYGLLGVSADPGKVTYVRQNVFAALWQGIERTYSLTVRILEYIRDIFSGAQSAEELGGVLRIAEISGQVAELGIASYISFLAVLSVNLGLINLFPIPLLDGGHLAFYAIEAVRGRPLGEKIQEYGFRLGLMLVVALFLFVTWNDLVHLKFISFITGLFT